MELSVSGRLRRPLRPPPYPLPFPFPSPRRPQPGTPSTQSSPPNFDLGGRLVPPLSLRSSPAPLCKSGSQLLAAAVARRASWAEPGGGLTRWGGAWRVKKWREQFYLKNPELGA